jgi:hypothetical protein
MFQLLRSIQIGQNCSEFYCLECISEKEVYIVYIFLLTKKLSKFSTPAGENRPCDEWSNKLLHNTRAETILIWKEGPSFPYCPLSFAAWNRQHQRVGCAPPCTTIAQHQGRIYPHLQGWSKFSILPTLFCSLGQTTLGGVRPAPLFHNTRGESVLICNTD